MKTLASTQIQFGGFIINSEDDAPIVQHLTRLITHAADAMACISEICHLLFILIPLMIELCHRILAVMEAIDECWKLFTELQDLFKPKWGYAPG